MNIGSNSVFYNSKSKKWSSDALEKQWANCSNRKLKSISPCWLLRRSKRWSQAITNSVWGLNRFIRKNISKKYIGFDIANNSYLIRLSSYSRMFETVEDLDKLNWCKKKYSQ